MKKLLSLLFLMFCWTSIFSAERFVVFDKTQSAFPLVSDGKVLDILYDANDLKGISIALNNLVEDFNMVCGDKPRLIDDGAVKSCIIVGSLDSKYIKQLIKNKKLDKKELIGRNIFR